MSETSKKLGLGALVLMIFTSVYGFNNIPRSFYKMGYASIPWFILSGILFFVPYAFMVAEFGSAFKNERGGIYSWMEKSVGAKYAFIGSFMWYTSYVLWMVNVGSGLWVPVSNALFGSDTTATWALGPLTGPKLLGVLGIIFILLVTYFATKGISSISKITSIGGTAVVVVNVVVFVGAIVMIIANGGKLAQPFNGIESLTTSPNPAYVGNPILTLAFIVYALFAYGGIEAVGGLVDQTENPNKTFPKGIVLAATVVVIGYSVLIFLVGSFTNWQVNIGDKGDAVHLGNISYVVMSGFGSSFAKILGMDAGGQQAAGEFFAHFYGLIMTLSLLGAFFTLIYAPLKQIVDGTPDELWPGKMGVTREGDGMPVNAMWIQAIIVCVLIALVSFGGDAMAKFFEILTAMVNVGMTIPYIFIAAAFPKFKNLKGIDRPFQVFKTKGAVMLATIAVTGLLVFANAFAIIQPAIDGDIQTTIWSVAGPVLFTVIAVIMYSNYEKKLAEKKNA